MIKSKSKKNNQTNKNIKIFQLQFVLLKHKVAIQLRYLPHVRKFRQLMLPNLMVYFQLQNLLRDVKSKFRFFQTLRSIKQLKIILPNHSRTWVINLFKIVTERSKLCWLILMKIFTIHIRCALFDGRKLLKNRIAARNIGRFK